MGKYDNETKKNISDNRLFADAFNYLINDAMHDIKQVDEDGRSRMAGGPSDCCAVLLRGGKSRRMGRDKSMLPWKGGTFLQAVAAQLDRFEEKYLSVAADGRLPEEEAPFLRDWVILPDRVPGCGPMGGIWTALLACRADWALAASCDIPAVEYPLIALLLESRTEEAQIVCPVTPDGHVHLTCALYRKELLACMGGQIRRGNYRLRDLLALCQVQFVAVTDPALVRMLANINTEEELSAEVGENG